MSTVIWHKEKLYADTQVSKLIMNEKGEKELVCSHKCTKLFKIGNVIYGATGTLTGWNNFKHRKFKRMPRLSINEPDEVDIIEYNGEKLKVWDWQEWKIPILNWYIFRSSLRIVKPTECTWISSGSGGVAASEALKAGLTAIEAIQYASDRDIWTNDEVEVMETNRGYKRKNIDILFDICRIDRNINKEE